jgi:hypothetical protein
MPTHAGDLSKAAAKEKPVAKPKPAPGGSGHKKLEQRPANRKVAAYDQLLNNGRAMPAAGPGAFGKAGLKQRGDDFFLSREGLLGHVLPEAKPGTLPQKAAKDEHSNFQVSQGVAAEVSGYRQPTASSNLKARPNSMDEQIRQAIEAGRSKVKKKPVPSTPQATD